MSTLTREFAVEGMHCQGCVNSVTGAVTRVPGVARVDVSLEKKAATVEFDAAAVECPRRSSRRSRRGIRRAGALERDPVVCPALARGGIIAAGRGVAQPGSALALGARCRRFESSHPDQDREASQPCATRG